MSASRGLTLDAFADASLPVTSQDPAFLETQAAMRSAYRREFDRFVEIALRLGRENGAVRRFQLPGRDQGGDLTFTMSFEGGFTAEDVVREFGTAWYHLPKSVQGHLPGCAIGSLRARGLIRVGCGGTSRRKSEHAEAKGRWVNVFEVTERALVNVETAPLVRPEVPTT